MPNAVSVHAVPSLDIRQAQAPNATICSQ